MNRYTVAYRYNHGRWAGSGRRIVAASTYRTAADVIAAEVRRLTPIGDLRETYDNGEAVHYRDNRLDAQFIVTKGA